MRALELGKIAAEAEKIRLQQMMRRETKRIIYCAVAVLFALAMFCMIHLLVWNLMALQFGPIWASSILLLADILVGGGFGLLGIRSRPGSVEQAAMEVRQAALKQAREAVAFLAAVPILRIVGGPNARDGVSLGRQLWRAFGK